MGLHRGFLTPEERARIMELQDLLIDRFVEQREATAEGQEERVKTVETEIDSLLREKKDIEKWAVAGSAYPHRIGCPVTPRKRGNETSDLGDPALAGYGRMVHGRGKMGSDAAADDSGRCWEWLSPSYVRRRQVRHRQTLHADDGCSLAATDLPLELQGAG
jgi:hypothetical protein